MLRTLVIDNYDSFTWNLVHLIAARTRDITVVRNDERPVAAILEAGFDAVILSPGPCTPNEAGICLDLIREGAGRVPIFGVCLGLQSIGQAFGGQVVRAPAPMHGKVSEILHEGAGMFRGCPAPLMATRYHSLVIDAPSCPDDLAVTARTRDGLIMAAAHRTLPVQGVQFHPESILSQAGDVILGNFLDMAGRWRNLEAGAARDNVM